METRERALFVIKQGIWGLILLGLFILIYLLGRKYIYPEYLHWLEPMLDQKILILFIFLISEVAIGILPPELFVMWAVQFGNFKLFTLLILMLAIISYLAGITGYFLGRWLHRSTYFRYLKARFLRKLDIMLHSFGHYLIFIAALTPLPFSGVCILVGSVHYPFRKFLLIALTRFLRFALYAGIFWESVSFF